MTNGSTYRHSRLAYLDTQAPLPRLADWAVALAVTVTKWSTRYRTRKALKKLPDHLFDDVGLDPYEAWREAALPFWKD